MPETKPGTVIWPLRIPILYKNEFYPNRLPVLSALFLKIFISTSSALKGLAVFAKIVYNHTRLRLR